MLWQRAAPKPKAIFDPSPGGDETILVATHVDDSIVTGSKDDKTDTFVREMFDRFDGTCERNLTEMPGMEWERDIEAGTIILHQKAFTRRSC